MLLASLIGPLEDLPPDTPEHGNQVRLGLWKPTWTRYYREDLSFNHSFHNILFINYAALINLISFILIT